MIMRIVRTTWRGIQYMGLDNESNLGIYNILYTLVSSILFAYFLIFY